MKHNSVINLSTDADVEKFYEAFKDPRCAAIKKDASVPDVGDTVVLNDYGLEQCFGSTHGLAHMKSMRMKITKVGAESITFPEATFAVEVDHPEINEFLVDHNCFDVVEKASTK